LNTVKTFCGICNGQCPIVVEIDDEKIVSVSGDADGYNDGFICPKGRAIPDILNSDERISVPLKKTESGIFEEISWQEAIAEISEKLLRIRQDYGANALAVHLGEAGVRKQFPYFYERFCQSYGTPNFSTSGSHCHISKTIAHKLVHGHGYPDGDYRNSDAIVLWGYNPAVSSPPAMIDINFSVQNGGKLVVIDPFKTPLAERADLYLQIRPGSDGALALGVLNLLIQDGSYDLDFVKNYTLGFEELSEYVQEFTLDKVELLTWISPNEVLELAKIYSESDRVSTLVGIALELQTNGVQSIRAIASLEALSENLDRVGGSRFFGKAAMTPLSLDRSVDGTPIGAERFPLFWEFTSESQANVLSESILEEKPYPIKGLMVVGSNPLLTWPDSNKVKSALGKLDFLVVTDMFMTETAKCADIVLPSSSFLERSDIIESIVGNELKLFSSPPALKKASVMSELEFLLSLSSAMGLGADFPWTSEVEALDYRLSNLGLTLDSLSSMVGGFTASVYSEKKYESLGFNTESGKVEFFSEKLKRSGYDPLPVYSDVAESMMSNTPNSPYIFTATSGKRTLSYYHSRFRNVSSLGGEDMVVYAHPSVFKKYHMGSDRVVDILSPRGSITAKLVMSEKLCPNTVSIPHGWDTANSNLLVDSDVLDPISGFPGARSFLVGIDGPEDSH
jgi:formate dehydrogenase (coenzyme F420) alpha subunit